MRRLLLVALAMPCIASAQTRLAPPAKDSTQVAYDDEGLRIHSADRTRQLKFRLLLDLDSRNTLSDTSDAATNTIAARRSRLYFDANVNAWMAFRLSLDIITPNIPPVTDAFVDLSFSPRWWMRIGRQKSNFGWERVLSITDTPLPERSLAAFLMPSRDLGAVLFGEFDHDRYEMSLGVFNGVPDGANGDIDLNDGKDLTFRAVARPDVSHGIHRGVGIGIEATTGVEKGTATNTQLPHLIARSTQTWFAFREGAGATIADGRHTRTGAFGYAHVGPWGVNAEFLQNRQDVRRGTAAAAVGSSGYYVAGDWVLTGEPSTEVGVAPAHEFDPAKKRWGALQLATMVSDVRIDDAAFPVYADPSLAARRATLIGTSLNWYFTRQTKVQASYEHTVFAGGAPNGGDRKTEQLALLRLQLYF